MFKCSPRIAKPECCWWLIYLLALPSWNKTVFWHRWFGMFNMMIDMDWNLGSQNHKNSSTFHPFEAFTLNLTNLTKPSNASTPVPPVRSTIVPGWKPYPSSKQCRPGSFGEKILLQKKKKTCDLCIGGVTPGTDDFFGRTPWHWGLVCLKLLGYSSSDKSLLDREKMRGPCFPPRLQQISGPIITNLLPALAPASPHQKEKVDRIHSSAWTIGTREWFSLRCAFLHLGTKRPFRFPLAVPVATSPPAGNLTTLPTAPSWARTS